MIIKVDLSMDPTNLYFMLVLLVLLGFFALLDGFYFVRIVLQYLYLRFVSKRTLRVDKALVTPGICLPSDLDINLRHMANARYLREADFSRFYWYQATGLLKMFGRGTIVQGACNARFRRAIGIFMSYKVVTSMVYYDEKSVYFEQKFISEDGFVRAVIYSQNKGVMLNPAELINKKLDKEDEYRLEMPEELKAWIESLEASSKALKKID